MHIRNGTLTLTNNPINKNIFKRVELSLVLAANSPLWRMKTVWKRVPQSGNLSIRKKKKSAGAWLCCVFGQ
jgi:hypothetical protein